MKSIAANLKAIRRQIAVSAARVNRDPAAIGLVAVTKYVELPLINEAIQAGVTAIGESRVQEAVKKLPFLAGPVSKHFIGTLQTNKIKPVMQDFDLIHSVDRIELIKALARESAGKQQPIEFLIQMNISGEATKHGFNADELEMTLAQIGQYPYLKPRGLMTMAPLNPDPETARPIFRRLKELFVKYKEDPLIGADWQYMSMGMSQDFMVAVEEGANLLRIGTAIFNLK
ncbi:MAG: YggS family pyridoxal phosphate-dependent enzyme [Bacillota bacterium]|jgi:pyridoxal phosphate enzyme (YggS family)